MKYDRENDVVTLDLDAYEEGGREVQRLFNDQDLYELREVILDLQDRIGATACPALESLYHQIALRVSALPTIGAVDLRGGADSAKLLEKIEQQMAGMVQDAMVAAFDKNPALARHLLV